MCRKEPVEPVAYRGLKIKLRYELLNADIRRAKFPIVEQHRKRLARELLEEVLRYRLPAGLCWMIRPVKDLLAKDRKVWVHRAVCVEEPKPVRTVHHEHHVVLHQPSPPGPSDYDRGIGGPHGW